MPLLFSLYRKIDPACVFRKRGHIKHEQNYKPGSVFDSHLSRRTVASTLQPPPGSGRANHALPSTVLLRIEFTAMDTLEPSGALLPHLSTLTSLHPKGEKAVYLCCTFPQIALGGRYPLSLPCGARTFLIDGLSACPRDCLSYSHRIFYKNTAVLSTSHPCFTEISGIFSKNSVSSGGTGITNHQYFIVIDTIFQAVSPRDRTNLTEAQLFIYVYSGRIAGGNAQFHLFKAEMGSEI